MNMARTIGTKNINIIKKIVENEIKKSTTKWGEITKYPSGDEIIEKLPEEMFETWEGAYSEIKNIIHDSVTNYNKELKKEAEELRFWGKPDSK